MSSFHFELTTGGLYADQERVDQAATGEGPPNLVQLLEVGKLFVVNAAILEQKPAETGIVPLKTILDVNKYGAVEADAYDRLDVDDWNMDDYVQYGLWLHDVTRHANQRKNVSQVTQVVLRQAHYMGIGAPEARITRKTRFGSLPKFREALGVVPAHKKDLFKGWSDQQLADHAESVFLKLLDKSDGSTGNVDLNAEIDRQAKRGPWPSCDIFRRDGRWPMKYMVLNGYVDVLSMGPKDYVDWGVNFRLANDGKPPTAQALQLLSKTRRAPSLGSFERNFHWGDYISEVDTAYEERKKQDRSDKMVAICQEATAGKLPAELVKDIEPEEAIIRRAKWHLVNELFPQLELAHKRVIAQSVAVDELEAVLVYTGDVDEFDIKDAATKVGVIEDLWPTDENRPFPYLRVPEGLLK